MFLRMPAGRASNPLLFVPLPPSSHPLTLFRASPALSVPPNRVTSMDHSPSVAKCHPLGQAFFAASQPDFARLAEAYGHVGIRVDKPGDVEGALREAFQRKTDLVFLDIQVDQTENVYPMVQGGKGLTDMILSAEDL